MKTTKLPYLFLSLCLFFSAIAVLPTLAQPAPIRQAAKSVFTLTTFRPDGSLLGSSHGIFTDTEGKCLSDLTPFIGAARAVVVDANGRQMDVNRIIGVDELYDICTFRVDGKTLPVSTEVGTTTPEGATVWLIPYTHNKSTLNAVSTTVRKKEPFQNDWSFYVFDLTVPENTVGCPFVNEQGQVLGLLQLTNSGNEVHAPSANWAMNTRSVMFGNTALLSQIGIPLEMPAGDENLVMNRIMLMNAGGGDNLKLAAAIADFIRLYPQQPDGYQRRAQMEADAAEYAAADRDMEKAISLYENKDEGYYAYGQLIYQSLLLRPQLNYAPWTFDAAISQARQANTINPQPVYQHLEAQIKFAQGNYQEAYDMFITLTHTTLRSPDLFYEASQALQLTAPNDTSYIALIDSAINACDTINHINPAPFILARAQAWEQAGQYRRAITDYNIYAYIMRPTLTAPFFYMREQCEVKGKLWQQALIDISTAIELDKQEGLYYAEKANLLLRVNQPSEAADIARQGIAIAPDYPDNYLILGLALIHQGQKDEGLSHLRQAQQLGSQQAQPLIEKYQ